MPTNGNVTGARFYKCALQVNSFDYLQRHSKQTSFSDEESYNKAIVEACLDHGIEVIAVTDHYRIKGAAKLIDAARSSGIIVFPGFEAVSKDGVHFLCILDPSSPIDLVQSKIAACGIHDDSDLSPNLVGGRGTGKSTIVESIRYVLGLEPSGEDAKKNHDGIIRHVVRNGTRIALRVHSYRPNRQTYTIERTAPDPPRVKDEDGNVLDVPPSAIVPTVEVYGQHEISELAKSPEKLTTLLGRFVDQDAAWLRKFEKAKDDLVD